MRPDWQYRSALPDREVRRHSHNATHGQVEITLVRGAWMAKTGLNPRVSFGPARETYSTVLARCSGRGANCGGFHGRASSGDHFASKRAGSEYETHFKKSGPPRNAKTPSPDPDESGRGARGSTPAPA